MSTKYAVQVRNSIVHSMTAGPFGKSGRVNTPDSGIGKADCGTMTPNFDAVSRITTEPVNCPKCLARLAAKAV